MQILDSLQVDFEKLDIKGICFLNHILINQLSIILFPFYRSKLRLMTDKMVDLKFISSVK